MAMSVQQGDLPQKENTMKRLFAGTLALVMTCGLLFSGCGKQMTPEEEAASQEAAISQQLQDEENKTGLKRLISNNLTEYEQPVHDFIEGLQDGDAEKTATALGVPNTFGEKLQDWVVVNDFETFQKTDMTNICLNSAKEGSKAAINVFMKTPEEVTADTSPDYTLTAEYTNGAWVLNPPTGIYDALLHNDLDKWEANFKYVPLSHPAASAWAVFKGMGERVQPNIVGGLNTRLQLFMTYKVRRVISNDDIRLANLGAEKTALFLIISDDNASMQLLSSLLLSFLFKDLKEAFDAVGGEGRIPVNVVADELANTGVWPNFEKTIATARSRKIAVSLILQSLPQLTQLYGEENAETIIGCCNTMLVLGCNDKYTAEYISDKSGIVTIRAKSVSDTRTSSAGNRGVMQGYSLSEGDGKRNLVNPDEVQHLDEEQILIMTNGQNMLEAKRFGFIHHPLFNDPHFVPTKWAELPKTADLYPNARKHDAIESRESSFGDIQRQKEINTDITQKRSEERMKPRLSKKDLLATDEPAPKKKNAFKK